MSANEVTTRNDLAWLASCYVLGEFSPEDAAAFELRLADDVAACEAVAAAARLHLALASAFESGESQAEVAAVRPLSAVDARISAPLRSSSVVAGTMVGLAAMAIAAASLALMIGRGSVETGIARRDGADKIVAAWISGEAARNADDDDDVIDSDDAADLEPPDWMLVALTAGNASEQVSKQDEVREN